ncbi:MAG: bacteriophage Gp15 family protein [Lachnospiraceae bacterium]
MNILYEPLPEYVVVHEKKYRIVTDFREWLKFLDLIQDESVPDTVKVDLLMQWYKEKPPTEEASLYALCDFLLVKGLYIPMGIDAIMESHNVKEGVGDDEKNDSVEPPSFSYAIDAPAILCAFLATYQIDLHEVNYLHWWKFKLLFDGLPENTEIKQRMAYRTAKIDCIKDKDEKRRIKDIKRRIALPIERELDDYAIGGMF